MYIIIVTLKCNFYNKMRDLCICASEWTLLKRARFHGYVQCLVQTIELRQSLHGSSLTCYYEINHHTKNVLILLYLKVKP